MRYCIRKETTGRIGSADFQRDLQTIRVFDTREEAIEGIRRRREQLSRCEADLYGSREDYFAVLHSGARQALVHYWLEEEKAEEKTVFELNATETERLRRFAAAHRRHGGSGSAGEFLQVSFVPTMLGTCSSARCLVCGAEAELTDTDEW